MRILIAGQKGKSQQSILQVEEDFWVAGLLGWDGQDSASESFCQQVAAEMVGLSKFILKAAWQAAWISLDSGLIKKLFNFGRDMKMMKMKWNMKILEWLVTHCTLYDSLEVSENLY